MKDLTTIFLALATFTTIAQIKFSEKTFENGMVYPVSQIQNNQAATDSMNAIIERNLTDAAASDFCIGDYGYFQK